MNEITPGKQVGEIANFELKAIGQKNTPLIEVTFKTSEGFVPWKAWPASENETYRESIVDTLRLMGFKGEDINELNSDENALDRETLFQIVVQYETGQDGIDRPSVRFVNELKDAPEVDTSELASKLSGINSLLKAGATPKKKASMLDKNYVVEEQVITTDDIPF
jgi:hypothetical protein